MDNGEANQSTTVQYIHEMNFEKYFIENSVQYAVAHEKLTHLVKQADVIMIENYEHG